MTARTATDRQQESGMQDFRDMLRAYLLPLLYGAEILGPETLDRGSLPPVCFNSRHMLRIALAPGSRIFFTLKRKVPFNEEERAFVEQVILGLHGGAGQSYDYSLVNSAVERAIAHRVNAEYAEAIFAVFQIYKEWSAPENAGALHTTGFYFSRGKGPGGNFFALKNETRVKAMGVSSDTLLALGRTGDILSVENIAPAPIDYRRTQLLESPLNYADLALWASSRRKAAVRLTSDGDILVFADKKLLFMRRGAYWRSYPHTLAGINELLPDEGPDLTPEVRKAVYLTGLDLSFAAIRACIGILPQGCRSAEQIKDLCPGRFLTSANLSGGDKLMAGLIKNKRFHDLARRFRMEMSAMDGALIIDNQGRILSVGAGFAALQEGDANLEREAARCFAREGLGVSIAENGTVEVFGCHSGACNQARPASA